MRPRRRPARPMGPWQRRVVASGVVVLSVLALDASCGTLVPRGLFTGCSDLPVSDDVLVDLTLVLPVEEGPYEAVVALPSVDASETTMIAGDDGRPSWATNDADIDRWRLPVDVTVTGPGGREVFRASREAVPRLVRENVCDEPSYGVWLQATPGGGLQQVRQDEEAVDAQGRRWGAVETTCGVLNAWDRGATYTRALGRLDDGAGGPPPGWGAPFQEGWVRVSDDALTFEDDRGHTELFLRQHGTAFPPACA